MGFLDKYVAQAGGPVAKSAPELTAKGVFFTNFFISRVDWWVRPEVKAFLAAIDATGDVYHHRWGDAPIQTAALRLFAEPSSILHLDIDYLHLSTRNRIRNGAEVPFNVHGIRNGYFRQVVLSAINAEHEAALV